MRSGANRIDRADFRRVFVLAGRARGRAAQLLAGLAHRGARLIDDADPEHEAVIDTVIMVNVVATQRIRSSLEIRDFLLTQ